MMKNDERHWHTGDRLTTLYNDNFETGTVRAKSRAARLLLVIFDSGTLAWIELKYCTPLK